jgi:PIN domain nuclease of toxin-antitoxin system
VRVLLDSNIIYWALTEPGRLNAKAHEIILDAENEAWVSAVSFAEFHIKVAIGKMKLPEGFHSEIVRLGYGILSFRQNHAHWLSSLPLHHRDPFDRMLIAQAMEEGLTLLYTDRAFENYSCARVFAG